MATIAKSGTPSLCTAAPPFNSQTFKGIAGEAIAAGDACYVKSDGLAWRANGTAANAAAKVIGFAAAAAAVGEAVTCYADVSFYYAAALTPGALYYLSATAGQLDDAATTGGTKAIAVALDATRIRVSASWRD